MGVWVYGRMGVWVSIIAIFVLILSTSDILDDLGDDNSTPEVRIA